MTTIDLLDLAADSPYTYAQLRELNSARALATAYVALPARLRMAVCAELALGSGAGLFEVQRRMTALTASWSSRAAA